MTDLRTVFGEKQDVSLKRLLFLLPLCVWWSVFAACAACAVGEGPAGYVVEIKNGPGKEPKFAAGSSNSAAQHLYPLAIWFSN